MHILRAMEAAGCTAAQVLAVLEADAALETALLDAVESGFADAPAQSPVSPPKQDSKTGLGAPVAEQIIPRVKREALAGLDRSGLRPAARAVGRRLVEPYLNLGSGRCDPSLDRLAGDTGFTRRSVFRALRELERAGLIAIAVHRGRNYSNAYAVNLHAMGELGAGAGKQDSGRTKPDSSPPKPDSHTETSVPAERSRRARRPRPPDPRQPEMLLPFDGGLALSRSEIAEQSAKARVALALNAHLGRFGPRFAARTRAEISAEAWAAAIAAEIGRQGAGIRVLLDSFLPPPFADSG